MKSTVNKITESAKRRDTIGRNKVRLINSDNLGGSKLQTIQDRTSSDNIEKMTHVILVENSKPKYLLKFRILEISNSGMIAAFEDINPEFEEADLAEEKEEESND